VNGSRRRTDRWIEGNRLCSLLACYIDYGTTPTHRHPPPVFDVRRHGFLSAPRPSRETKNDPTKHHCLSPKAFECTHCTESSHTHTHTHTQTNKQATKEEPCTKDNRFTLLSPCHTHTHALYYNHARPNIRIA